MRKKIIIPKQKRVYTQQVLQKLIHTETGKQNHPWDHLGEEGAAGHSSGASPGRRHSIKSVCQRSLLELSLSKFTPWCTYFPAFQGQSIPNARSFSLPYNSPNHPWPCLPPTKISRLNGASWKVAITNPIYHSQRDKNQKVAASESVKKKMYYRLILFINKITSHLRSSAR